jgi:hypothetical protein
MESASGALFDTTGVSPKSTAPPAAHDAPPAATPIAPRYRRPATLRSRGSLRGGSALGVAALVLASCVLAVTARVEGQAASSRVAPSPVGTMSELMVKIIYPASDAIFYVTTRTPSTAAEWTDLQAKALMVAESANLLMLPGRLRDDDRWMADAKLMRDAGAAALKAANARDVEALANLNDALYQSCVTCHRHYRPGYGRGR